MTKIERINKAVNYLIFNGTINEKKDISTFMDVNNSNVSSALNGNSKYLTDRFLKKFAKTFSISETWLLSGSGEMLTGISTIKDELAKEPGPIYITAREEILQNRIKQLEDQLDYEKLRNGEYIETARRLNDLEQRYNTLVNTVDLLVKSDISDLKKRVKSVEGKTK